MTGAGGSPGAADGGRPRRVIALGVTREREAAGAGAEGAGGAAPVARPGEATEVVLNGRRYLMVPIDPEPGPAGRADAPAPVGPAATGSLRALPRPGPASLLTARELQIAALVAEGLVNKQIAAELSISEWTVSTHLRRIFAKLGVDTRAAMVGRCASILPGGPF